MVRKVLLRKGEVRKAKVVVVEGKKKSITLDTLRQSSVHLRINRSLSQANRVSRESRDVRVYSGCRPSTNRA